MAKRKHTYERAKRKRRALMRAKGIMRPRANKAAEEQEQAPKQDEQAGTTEE
jgi:hypothetical protein